LIDKFDAAGISIPPHHATTLCRFEAIQRQIKFERGSVMRRRMKHGSITVEIFHQAGMAAANAVNVKQRELVDCNALQGSTFNHRNNPKLF
jgi:hypothetical protein